MDYKEKYEQALERARQFSEKPLLEDSAGIVEYIFPELKESEDEKIRKDMIDTIKQEAQDFPSSIIAEKSNKWLAWLEKQGEQKLLIEKLPEEMKTIGESLGFTTQEESDKYNQMVSDLIMSDGNKGEQKSAWSEEDEEHIESILKRLDGMCKKGATFTETCFAVNQDMDWLKSLKDRVQPTLAWNENDEVALDSAATNYAQDKYLPVQTSQAFKAGARWVLTSLTTSSPTGQAPT